MSTSYQTVHSQCTYVHLAVLDYNIQQFYELVVVSMFLLPMCHIARTDNVDVAFLALAAFFERTLPVLHLALQPNVHLQDECMCNDNHHRLE